MGIDIYMTPNVIDGDNVGQDESRIKYFSDTSGADGYLREAYHGGPYMTEVLVPEAFKWSDWIDQSPCEDVGNWPQDLLDALGRGAPIPAADLRGRLRKARATLKKRYALIYPDTSPEDVKAAQDTITAFVELAERIEKATGEPVQIYASY